MTVVSTAEQAIRVPRVATGTLIAESIRPGATLGEVPLAVHKIERVEPDNISDEQLAAGLPARWTLLHFEVADDAAPALADALAPILDEPGWYVDFHTGEETFVVFAGVVFRYRTGDADGRAEAEAHARAHKVPDTQIDWP
jgi:hypothetical protein